MTCGFLIASELIKSTFWASFIRIVWAVFGEKNQIIVILTAFLYFSNDPKKFLHDPSRAQNWRQIAFKTIDFSNIFRSNSKITFKIRTPRSCYRFFFNFTDSLINYSWWWPHSGSELSEFVLYITASLYTKFGFSINFYSMFVNFTSYTSTLISLIIHDNDVTMCQNFQNYLFTLWRVCIPNLNFPPIFLLFF